MQKIGSLLAYSVMVAGQNYRFPVAEGRVGSRQVKFKTLTYEPVQIWVNPADDPETGEVSEAVFLTVPAIGLDEIEFHITGEFDVNIVGGDLRLDTFDNAFQDVGEDTPDESFARLYERQDTDPRILEVQQMARHHMRRLEEQAAEDRARYSAELVRVTKEANDAINSVKSSATSSSTSPTPAGGVVPSGSDSKTDKSADSGASGKSDASA